MLKAPKYYNIYRISKKKKGKKTLEVLYLDFCTSQKKCEQRLNRDDVVVTFFPLFTQAFFKDPCAINKAAEVCQHDVNFWLKHKN